MKCNKISGIRFLFVLGTLIFVLGPRVKGWLMANGFRSVARSQVTADAQQLYDIKADISRLFSHIRFLEATAVFVSLFLLIDSLLSLVRRNDRMPTDESGKPG
jgi:hypothetical protein